MENRKCASPKKQARGGVRRKSKETTGNSKEDEEVGSGEFRELVIKADKVNFNTGEVFLLSGKEQFILRVVSGESGPIQLPVRDTQFEIRADAFLSHLPNLTAYPIRLLLTWNGSTEEMSVVLSLKNLPLSVVESMFPEVKERARLLAGASQVEGAISGQLSLVLSSNLAGDNSNASRSWGLR